MDAQRNWKKAREDAGCNEFEVEILRVPTESGLSGWRGSCGEWVAEMGWMSEFEEEGKTQKSGFVETATDELESDG